MSGNKELPPEVAKRIRELRALIKHYINPTRKSKAAFDEEYGQLTPEHMMELMAELMGLQDKQPDDWQGLLEDHEEALRDIMRQADTPELYGALNTYLNRMSTAKNVLDTHPHAKELVNKIQQERQSFISKMIAATEDGEDDSQSDGEDDPNDSEMDEGSDDDSEGDPEDSDEDGDGEPDESDQDGDDGEEGEASDDAQEGKDSDSDSQDSSDSSDPSDQSSDSSDQDSKDQSQDSDAKDQDSQDQSDGDPQDGDPQDGDADELDPESYADDMMDDLDEGDGDGEDGEDEGDGEDGDGEDGDGEDGDGDSDGDEDGDGDGQGEDGEDGDSDGDDGYNYGFEQPEDPPEGTYPISDEQADPVAVIKLLQSLQTLIARDPEEPTQVPRWNVEKLVRLMLEPGSDLTRAKEPTQIPQDIVFFFDNSGSMNEFEKAARRLAQAIGEAGDLGSTRVVSIVTSNGQYSQSYSASDFAGGKDPFAPKPMGPSDRHNDSGGWYINGEYQGTLPYDPEIFSNDAHCERWKWFLDKELPRKHGINPKVVLYFSDDHGSIQWCYMSHHLKEMQHIWLDPNIREFPDGSRPSNATKWPRGQFPEGMGGITSDRLYNKDDDFEHQFREFKGVYLSSVGQDTGNDYSMEDDVCRALKLVAGL